MDMTLTLSREERDTLYLGALQQLRLVSGHTWPEELLRLLDDLGWEPDDARNRFGLTLGRRELASLLDHMAEVCETTLRDVATSGEVASHHDVADDALDRLSLCRRLLDAVEADAPRDRTPAPVA
jgi:hypothetical protein